MHIYALGRAWHGQTPRQILYVPGLHVGTNYGPFDSGGSGMGGVLQGFAEALRWRCWGVAGALLGCQAAAAALLGRPWGGLL